jgi:septum formation protein
MRVVLASASPRRHVLLKQVVDDFEICPADLDEDTLTLDDPYETAVQLATLKAKAVARVFCDAAVIGSDTVVALRDGGGWKQLSKPTDRDDAFRILSTLAGRSHVVITGVAVVKGSNVQASYAESKVTFNCVSTDQIWDYIDTGEPMDKAGAYGAQGMGSFLVKSIEGGYDTVVGLPVELVKRLLAKFA